MRSMENLQFALSISESEDLHPLGYSEHHLTDAMTEVARHLLANGCNLIYGGDLRSGGFTELLFELVARHCRDTDEEVRVSNYFAWPVHQQISHEECEELKEGFSNADFLFLDLDGKVMDHCSQSKGFSTDIDKKHWDKGLTSLRKVMTDACDFRIILGGKRKGYKGSMPGVAQEALMCLQNQKPLFLIGGFGGCSSGIAASLGLEAKPIIDDKGCWDKWDVFDEYDYNDLNNGLNFDENNLLSKTPYIEEAISLILRGAQRILKRKGVKGA